MSALATEAWTFFFRASNRNVERMRSEQNKRSEIVYLARGLAASEALALAQETKAIPIGTNRSGCYEIQGPEGVWRHKKENKIDFSTPRRAANVIHFAWDDDAMWED